MRHETEYYRVTFYGFGFPELLRNRTFIYRGKEYEQLPSFSARILNQHPRAELMQTLEKPNDEILNSEGQYIQINKVEPIVSERNQEIQNIAESKNIAQSIVKYYRTNNVDNFKFSRPFRDNSKNWQEGQTNDPDNIGNLWLERTIMKTEFPLPGILKWFPVESSETFNVRLLTFYEVLNFKFIIIFCRFHQLNVPLNRCKILINHFVILLLNIKVMKLFQLVL